MSRLICGVGICDAEYQVRKFGGSDYKDGKRKQNIIWQCTFYAKWKDIIKRCYSNKLKTKYKTYKDCSVCDEWLVFSNFKAWMEKQDWEGMEIDKDILFPGNKLYSPETCVFISKLTNTFITGSDATRGAYFIGVSLYKGVKFQSQCRNPITKTKEHLGYFASELDAHLAWKRRKHELAQIVADLEPNKIAAASLRLRYR